MDYTQEFAEIVSKHEEQIEADLSSARHEYEDAHAALRRAERRVQLLEGVLTMRNGPSNGIDSGPQAQLTLHAAMHKVLMDSPRRRMRAGEIVTEIERRGLYRMRDGRPPETQQIHARAGHYPDMFGKDGPFFYPK
jgi:hypothetical protein